MHITTLQNTLNYTRLHTPLTSLYTCMTVHTTHTNTLDTQCTHAQYTHKTPYTHMIETHVPMMCPGEERGMCACKPKRGYPNNDDVVIVLVKSCTKQVCSYVMKCHHLETMK